MKLSMIRLVGLGALGTLCIVAADGALHLLDRPAAAPAQQAAAAKPSAKTPISSNGDDLDVPSVTDNEAVLRSIGEARRLADDGRFAEAEAKLVQAEKAAPGLRETADARRKITELGMPQGQLSTQLARARSAIEQDDDAAAAKALAEAERLAPQAPEIAPLRQAFEANRKNEARRYDRIQALLAKMRKAIARRDFVGADSALNEASRIDVLDPALDQARTELAHAHDEARKEQSSR